MAKRKWFLFLRYTASIGAIAVYDEARRAAGVGAAIAAVLAGRPHPLLRATAGYTSAQRYVVLNESTAIRNSQQIWDAMPSYLKMLL